MLTITCTLNPSVLLDWPKPFHQSFASELTESIATSYPGATVNVIEAHVSDDFEVRIDGSFISDDDILAIAICVNEISKNVFAGAKWVSIVERVVH